MRRTEQGIRRLLAEKGIKATPQRIAVYQALEELEHASAEQIALWVRVGFPTVTTGTVYNVLDRLTASGVITKINTSDNKMVFDINAYDHHHLLCEETGQIADIGDSELTRVVREYYEGIKAPEGFELTGIRIQFIGHFK